ncbi:MAG: hypothetical protein ABMA64_34755 [Myxococcota bacterium]
MIRNFGAVVVGLFVGMLVNMSLILLNTQVLFPVPPELNPSDPAQLAVYVASLPVAALVVVVAAHLGQAFVGGWVAARLAGSAPRVPALIVGALTLVGGVLNLRTLHGPAWMWLEVPLYLVVAWAAGELEVRRRG